MSFNTIPEILEDIRAGRMVVILDDEDRENEGDIVMAASMVRPEDVNFMVREARGLLCLTLTEQRTRQLGLRPMVSDNTSPYQTNFTVSIEAAEGVTTGISAHDRARTIQVAVKSDAKPQDLSQPGPHLPADRPARRRADPRRPYRSRLRPGRAGRAGAGLGADRDPARGRLDGASPRAGGVRAEARPEDRHHRRPDPLPAGNGKDRRARARGAGRYRVRRVHPGGLPRRDPARPAFRAGARRGRRRRAGADPGARAQYACPTCCT